MLAEASLGELIELELFVTSGDGQREFGLLASQLKKTATFWELFSEGLVIKSVVEMALSTGTSQGKRLSSGGLVVETLPVLSGSFTALCDSRLFLPGNFPHLVFLLLLAYLPRGLAEPGVSDFLLSHLIDRGIVR